MADGGAGTAMRVSMFSVCDHYPDEGRTTDRFVDEILDEIVLAEELGYPAYWIAEHHFHEYGMITNPAQFLAVAAARTKRIRLGPAISVLTFHNPLLVAEDYAFLDRLSGGRLNMGVGSGYLAHEFGGFAIPPAEKRERFDTCLDILKRAWAGETIRHDTSWFKTDGARLAVLPAQTPLPPIWIAVIRREAAYHVGRQGNRAMFIPYATLDRLEEFGPLLSEYQSGLAESGQSLTGETALFAMHTYVAESDEACRADTAGPYGLYVATRLYGKKQTYDEILRSGLALFGSVDRVADMLVELHGMGIRHVQLVMNFGAMPADKVHRSMRLMAEEVMPMVAARTGATV